MLRWPLLLCATCFAAAGFAAKPPATDLVQPASSARGLYMESAPGRASIVEAEGARRRLRLRRDELLTSLVETSGGWVAAGTRGDLERRELVVVEGRSGGLVRLPAPEGPREPLRLRPVPLSDDGELTGMAWLEGSEYRALAVRAAGWSGAAWEPPTPVAAPGPGSQTGLTGAVLDDGSWLLVWSAFDGQDDEIVWSWRRGENWSPRQRLTAGNAVPDIQPTLLSVPGGALVAWSRYQGGGYSVVTAEFRGGRWSAPRSAGAPGTLAPSLTRAGRRNFLVFQHSWPAAWSAVELSAGGRALRRALFPVTSSERPVLLAPDQGRAHLRWPASEDREAAWENLP